MPIKFFDREKRSRGASNSRSKPSRPFDFSRLVTPGLVVVAVISLMGVFRLVDNKLSVPVARVVVTGELQYMSKQSVVDELRPYLENGFLQLDLDSIREHLLTRPWVYEVNVSRKWPDEIAISIVEETAIARWGRDGLLNHRGDLFAPNNLRTIELSNSLPLLEGPEHSVAKVMTHYREWQLLLQKNNLAVYQLSLSAGGGWEAVIGSDSTGRRIPVMLGSADVMEKMRRFISVYETELVDKFERLERIDVRYSRGLAVQWNSDKKESEKKSS